MPNRKAVRSSKRASPAKKGARKKPEVRLLEAIFGGPVARNPIADENMRMLIKKVREGPLRLPPGSKPYKPLEEPKVGAKTRKLSKKEILAPLREVFLDDVVKDDAITATAIPELLYREQPGYYGVILYGPGGTGKTSLLRAIANVYIRAGAYALEVSTSEVHTKWAGELAKNLEAKLKEGVEEARKRKKPSFVWLDESTIFAQKAEAGAAAEAKHYQEALDVLKRYVGNYKELVVGISTNASSETFDEPLVRDGRLRPIYVGPPSKEQVKQMWAYFTDKYNILNLNKSQCEALANEGDVSGAFVSSFCKNYNRLRRSIVLKARGYRTLLGALEEDVRVREDKVRATITFDQFKADLTAVLKSRYRQTTETKEPIGFVHTRHSRA